MNTKVSNGDGKFKLDHLSDLLDTIVPMHWDLTNGLHDGADLPGVLSAQIENVDRELRTTIGTLKALLEERVLADARVGPQSDGQGR